MVKPSRLENMNVPINDTGIANTGIKVALQLCRNKKTTSTPV
jgi:hypothetical protein